MQKERGSKKWKSTAASLKWKPRSRKRRRSWQPSLNPTRPKQAKPPPTRASPPLLIPLKFLLPPPFPGAEGTLIPKSQKLHLHPLRFFLHRPRSPFQSLLPLRNSLQRKRKQGTLILPPYPFLHLLFRNPRPLLLPRKQRISLMLKPCLLLLFQNHQLLLL